MCIDHHPHSLPSGRPATQGGLPPFSRRRLMAALAGVGGMLLVGCVGEGDTGLGLNLVSDEQIRQLGVESWQRIRSETPASNNAEYQQAAEQIAGDILRAAGEDPREWEVVVFEGDEANAFALPGNKIGVYEGLFRYAQNPDQLATVIGHEVAHNQAEHAAERLNSAAATQAGLQLVSVALQAGNIGYANEIAALLGAGAQYGLILPYTRNQELEADKLGLLNMARAGYDPRASIALWQNMESAGGRPPDFLSTHPSPGNRIAQLEALMPQALEVYQANS